MTILSQNADTVSYPMRISLIYSIRAQILTHITRMILVLGKSALSVPDTRFSRVSGSTLVLNQYSRDDMLVILLELLELRIRVRVTIRYTLL